MIWKTVITAIVAFLVGSVFAFLLFRQAMKSSRGKRKTAGAKTGSRSLTVAGKIASFFGKLGTMNLILVFIFVSATVFTVVMIRIFLDTGMIPDTLVTCVFTFLGGECGFMAVIRSFKERMRDRKIELEDRAYYERKEQENSEQQGG